MVYDPNTPVGRNKHSDAEFSQRPSITEEDRRNAAMWSPDNVEASLRGAAKANDMFRDAARNRIRRAQKFGPEVVDRSLLFEATDRDPTPRDVLQLESDNYIE